MASQWRLRAVLLWAALVLNVSALVAPKIAGRAARSPAAAAAALSDGKSTFVGKKNRLEACEVVGRAFAGTETTDPEQTVNWLLGPYLPIGEPDRIPLTTFFMSFAVAILAPSGFTLCAHSADGAIQAVCLCCY